MAEKTVTLYVRIPIELNEQLDAWIEETNAAMKSWAPKMPQSEAVRALLGRGLEAMRSDAELAAAELAREQRPALKRVRARRPR